MHDLKVSILGSGNVAHHLIYRLKTAGIPIVNVYARSYAQRNMIAEKFLVNVSDIPKRIDSEADILIIAIRDDAISTLDFTAEEMLVVHTGGNVAMKTLSGISDRIGVFYPVQSLKIGNFDDERIEMPFLIEASDSKGRKKLEELAEALGSDYDHADEEKRRVVHLSAVFAQNFTNHMWRISEMLLEKNKLDFNIIKPLIINSINQLKDHSPSELQTGPASRKDEKTMENHKKMLEDHSDWKQLYDTISKSIIKFD